MRKINDFSAIIFDMDGLVLDTESTYFAAWQKAAKAMGFDFPDVFFPSFSGLHFNDVELKLLTLYGDDFNLLKFNQLSGVFWREHVYTHGISIKSGFKPLIAFINQQQIPFCLATNSLAVNAYECLELAGIREVFTTVITRDDIEHGKPAPDIFLKAAEVLNVVITDCLVLEDSYAGIKAASSAGAFSVFVPSTQPIDPLGLSLCDVMMPDLVQALILLESVND